MPPAAERAQGEPECDRGPLIWKPAQLRDTYDAKKIKQQRKGVFGRTAEPKPNIKLALGVQEKKKPQWITHKEKKS